MCCTQTPVFANCFHFISAIIPHPPQMRHLVVLLDSSRSMEDKDLRPDRFTCCKVVSYMSYIHSYSTSWVRAPLYRQPMFTQWMTMLASMGNAWKWNEVLNNLNPNKIIGIYLLILNCSCQFHFSDTWKMRAPPSSGLMDQVPPKVSGL